MSSDLKGSIRGTCEIGDSGRSFNIAAAGRTRQDTARHSEAGFKWAGAGGGGGSG